jgi:hypothetical protein
VGQVVFFLSELTKGTIDCKIEASCAEIRYPAPPTTTAGLHTRTSPAGTPTLDAPVRRTRP